jgi:uncharacterized membrane protein YphA (DoxX/SURF4 family)
MEGKMLARQIAIGFGIAMIFPLLVYYGVSTFYSPPKFNAIVTATVFRQANPTPEQQKEYEDRQRERQKQQDAYTTAARDFARVLVMVSTPLGVAAILIGAYLKFYAIGTGLIFGGIFAVAWGYWTYWNYLDDWMRFVSLLLGFVILVFVGYRRVAGVSGQP